MQLNYANFQASVDFVCFPFQTDTVTEVKPASGRSDWVSAWPALWASCQPGLNKGQIFPHFGELAVLLHMRISFNDIYVINRT